jgi:hypothetical protein
LRRTSVSTDAGPATTPPATTTGTEGKAGSPAPTTGTEGKAVSPATTARTATGTEDGEDDFIG